MSKAEVTLVGLFGMGPGGLRLSAIAAAIVGGSGLLALGSIVGPVGAGEVIELANAVGGADGNVEGVVHHGCGRGCGLPGPLGGPKVGAVAKKGGLTPPWFMPVGKLPIAIHGAPVARSLDEEAPGKE